MYELKINDFFFLIMKQFFYRWNHVNMSCLQNMNEKRI